MTRTESTGGTWVLTSDGATIHVRRPEPRDEDAVLAMHRAMSVEDLRLRFFGISDTAVSQAARRICAVARPGCGSLVAVSGDRIVGVAEYIAIAGSGAAEGSGEAELALAVADSWHGRGVGTLLIEHLVAFAREDGIRALVADTLTGNRQMLRVFADMGLPVHSSREDDVVRSVIPLDVGAENPGYDTYLEAMGAREGIADVASLIPLFRPRSIAVAGAGRRADSVGRALLRNVCDGGFGGTVSVLHPSAHTVEGIRAHRRPADLPQAPDLVIVAVPAAAVPDLAEDCGRAGVRALLVVTSGLTAEQGTRLRASCRRHGMRMVGPNCLGLARTDPDTSLNATFAPLAPLPGGIGVAVQSGGVGIALIGQLNRLGIGTSTFASLGDKYDVSGNDMLQVWAADDRTTMAVLHLESFGNPRKFSRIVRRVGRGMPVLTVDTGRSAAGRRAAGSHTAAAVTPTVARGALFTQAGVTATRSLGDLIATAALLHAQPLPQGPSIAVVGNAGGAGVLAADACVDAGLAVPSFDADLESDLRALLPPGAACGNPVDTTAVVDAGQLHACVDRVLASGHVDAVVLALVPTALGDPLADVLRGPSVREHPVVVVAPDRAASVELRTGADGGGTPVYNDTRTAAVALAHAVDRTMWLTRPRGTVRRPADLDRATVRTLIREFLREHPEGGWLPPRACARVLTAYGIPQSPWRHVRTAEEAVAAGRELGPLGDEGRVALKAHGPDLVHKTDAGGVRLRLLGDEEIGDAFTTMADHLGTAMRGAVVQPMAPPGIELIAGVTQDEVLGPLIMFGLGGVTTDVLDDHGARLTPLTDLDAAALITGSRASRLLYGHRGSAPADTDAVADLLQRLSHLADDHPQVTDAEFNPLIARPDGVIVVDTRIHLAPRTRTDPYLRHLR
ncbi:bifunctional acetate--CoA ligase family protein/GNAT family N-acetyltransferase [Embleya sp. NPDC055664]